MIDMDEQGSIELNLMKNSDRENENELVTINIHHFHSYRQSN